MMWPCLPTNQQYSRNEHESSNDAEYRPTRIRLEMTSHGADVGDVHPSESVQSDTGDECHDCPDEEHEGKG